MKQKLSNGEQGAGRDLKPIRLTKHAQGYVERRGFTAEEVEKAIRTGVWKSAEKKGRLECEVEIEFGKDWNGRRYAWKKVNPIFVEEETEIVVITV